MRTQAAEQKYAEAVEMYAATALPVREIARECGVTAEGLASHIGKHHRPLLLARYGLQENDADMRGLKVKAPKGQSLLSHLKYKAAIEACGDVAYIEYNVAQVAAMFGLDGPALASQLRMHYPDVIPMREKLRRRLGIADNTHRGARKQSSEAYAHAMEMYRSTEKTIAEVAHECGVSESGFGRFLRFYHKDIIGQRSARRKQARKLAADRKPGKL
ncbi:MAG: hypothetical protein NC102_00780, partial [Clostridium sp.]|nr:hypothetical protein [Clostridium sp.]